MADVLISRSALLREYGDFKDMDCPSGHTVTVDYMIELAEDAPAVDAEPVRHGVWKPVMLKNVFGQEYVYRHACPICHEYALCEHANYDAEEELSNYCPNCGAKMRGDVNAD